MPIFTALLQVITCFAIVHHLWIAKRIFVQILSNSIANFGNFILALSSGPELIIVIVIFSSDYFKLEPLEMFKITDRLITY